AEETAKALPLLLLLGDRRYRFQIDGLVFGVAAGMGVTLVENAYHAIDRLRAGGWGGTIFGMFIQALIAPFSHGTWTAIIGAAMWTARATGRGRVQRVAVALITSVTLHALWDLDAIKHWLGSVMPAIDPALLYSGIWQPLVGVVGLLLLHDTFWRGL